VGERTLQSTAPFVGESDPPFPEVFVKDAVFFPEVVDRGLLMAVDPASEGREQNLPGLKDVRHERIVVDCDWSSQLPPATGKR